jgi:hypothetical protein
VKHSGPALNVFGHRAISDYPDTRIGGRCKRHKADVLAAPRRTTLTAHAGERGATKLPQFHRA